MELEGNKMIYSMSIKILLVLILGFNFISCANETTKEKNTNSKNKSSTPIDLIKIGKSYSFVTQSDNPDRVMSFHGKVIEINQESGWIKLQYLEYGKTTYPIFKIDNIESFREQDYDMSQPVNKNK